MAAGRPGSALALASALALTVCGRGGGGGGGAPAVATRTFALGFTGFPHDFSTAAVADAFSMIAADGDLVVYHFDNGVPWNEELAGAAHPDEANVVWQRSLAPAGHRILLDVTPIAITRDRLAPFYDDVPLAPPWDAHPFDHPDVVTAFRNYCEQMIALMQPDWFMFAIEANMLHEFTPASWAAFVSLANQTYASVKAAHPTLPVFISLQTDHYWQHRLDGPDATTGLTHAQAISQLLAASDFVALSSYPIVTATGADPNALPDDYFDAVAALAPGKPFAIAETGWQAETIDAPYPVTIPTDAGRQRDYVDFLLERADRRQALFISWFLTWDYDDLWDSGVIPQVPLNRFFRDMGLKDGAGADRTALTPWRAWLARPRIGG